MKNLCFGSVALIALAAAGSAIAADMPVRTPVYKAAPAAIMAAYNWSGFYAGGHLGYLWGSTRVLDNGVVTDANARTNGVVGGVLAGVNWQTGAFVYGLEGDFGWANVRGTGHAVTPVELPNEYKVKWTADVRARVGYTVAPMTLVFVAGGLALADFNFREGEDAAPTTPGAVFPGWTIGGGIDQAFTNNLIGRLEYLYADYGGKSYTLAPDDVYEAHFKGHTLRGAIIWKFDWGKGPVAGKGPVVTRY
jgi:outer membrane immunogenic protein